MKPVPIIEKGGESSFWVRSMRMLFDYEKGWPLSPMTLLSCKLPSGSQHLFGCLTQTRDRRLVFWPPLPKDVQLLSDDGKRGVTDHVTLELGSRKCHVTSFQASGKRNHYRDRWALDMQHGSSLSLWFNLLVPLATLRDQDHEVSVNVPMPTNDTQRRTAEFTRQAQTCRVRGVEPPLHAFAGDYLFCLFYVQTRKELTPAGFQINLRQHGLDRQVTGFRDDVPIWLSPLAIEVEDTRVVVFSAIPPGTSNGEVMLGFPRRGNGNSMT